MSLSREHCRTLDEDSYVVVEDAMSNELLAKLRRRVDDLFTEEGERAGSEFKLEPGCRRLANLVDKGDVFQEVIANARILEYVRHVLGPDIKLSSLNARSVSACGGAQPLHADMGAVADAKGYWVCNTIWPLDDYTPENGALRLVSGSHRWRKLPQDALADPLAAHPNQIVVTCRAGSVVVVNAHAWHGGMQNRTERPRTSLHAFYCRRDRPQQQYQKRLLRPTVQQALSPELRHLLALDDPLNDQLSTEVAVRSGFLK
jgi:ectoine hydroxylase-related dioxygenase (phytanoyl-CoA dioxygenase family)